MTTQTEVPEEGVEIQTVEPSALANLDATAVQMAKAHLRSTAAALKEARELATMDEQTAGSMFYALPRGGKSIEGPSARLAEVMAYSWGNLIADAEVSEEGRTHITAIGSCIDLERLVAIRVRVRRRITNRSGKRYDEDMIGVTGNAAISIALRNAVFKVIPRSFTDGIYQAARRASLGEGGTVVQKRQQAFEWFAKLGVKPEEIFALLQIEGAEDIGEDELIALRGLVTAIQDGDTTVERTFRPERTGEPSEGAQSLQESISGAGAPSEGHADRPTAADPVQGESAPAPTSTGEGVEAGNAGPVQPSHEQASDTAAPSPEALAEAEGLKKADLVEGIQALERQLGGVPLDDAPEPDAKVGELRTYYARLADAANQQRRLL